MCHVLHIHIYLLLKFLSSCLGLIPPQFSPHPGCPSFITCITSLESSVIFATNTSISLSQHQINKQRLLKLLSPPFYSVEPIFSLPTSHQPTVLPGSISPSYFPQKYHKLHPLASMHAVCLLIWHQPQPCLESPTSLDASPPGSSCSNTEMFDL